METLREVLYLSFAPKTPLSKGVCNVCSVPEPNQSLNPPKFVVLLVDAHKTFWRIKVASWGVIVNIQNEKPARTEVVIPKWAFIEDN